MRIIRWGAAGILAVTGLTAIVAQTVDGLDVQAVKRRAAGMEQEARDFSEQVKHRGDAFREEALTVREGGIENMRQVATKDLPAGPKGPIDFDEIVQGAASNMNKPGGQAPQLIVFASLSMPPASLKQLIRDTAAAGGVVVFRGFPNNSMKAFTAGLSKVVEQEDQLANIGIDPRLFRAFDVKAVPTYVAVSSDFDLCDGFTCRTAVPPHDRMTGNVTLDYALTSFADASGPGSRVAAVGLRQLHRSANP